MALKKKKEEAQPTINIEQKCKNCSCFYEGTSMEDGRVVYDPFEPGYCEHHRIKTTREQKCDDFILKNLKIN